MATTYVTDFPRNRIAENSPLIRDGKLELVFKTVSLHMKINQSYHCGADSRLEISLSQHGDHKTKHWQLTSDAPCREAANQKGAEDRVSKVAEICHLWLAIKSW